MFQLSLCIVLHVVDTPAPRTTRGEEREGKFQQCHSTANLQPSFSTEHGSLKERGERISAVSQPTAESSTPPFHGTDRERAGVRPGGQTGCFFFTHHFTDQASQACKTERGRARRGPAQLLHSGTPSLPGLFVSPTGPVGSPVKHFSGPAQCRPEEEERTCRTEAEDRGGHQAASRQKDLMSLTYTRSEADLGSTLETTQVGDSQVDLPALRVSFLYPHRTPPPNYESRRQQRRLKRGEADADWPGGCRGPRSQPGTGNSNNNTSKSNRTSKKTEPSQ
ncbi:hypothetical protein DPEC_G00259660 [Dallia pectoralis]|uniref:Uncharacterized protein n=1 Tax=Dallia pectoralis TaxID=75939 RepID=A0ACC2FRL6_DALPE|nr:hypothetical protein DPEC_G00259660 [Dallia pectoralis]